MAWPPSFACRRVALVIFGLALMLHLSVTGMLLAAGLSVRATVIGSELIALLGFSLLLAHLLRLPFTDAFALRPAAPVHWMMAIGAALPLQLAGGSLQFATVRTLPEDHPLRQFMERAVGELVRIETALDVVMLISAAVIVAAVCEEFLFRGLLLQLLRRRSGWVSAIVWVAVLFALFHLNPIVLVPISIVGAYLGLLVWRSGSLYPAIVAHAANNFFGLFGLPLLLQEATYERYLPAIFTTSTVAFGALLWMYLRNTEPPVDPADGFAVIDSERADGSLSPSVAGDAE